MTNAEWMLKNNMSFDKLAIREDPFAVRTDAPDYREPFTWGQVVYKDGNDIRVFDDFECPVSGLYSTGVSHLTGWLNKEHEMLNKYEKDWLKTVIKPFISCIDTIEISQDVDGLGKPYRDLVIRTNQGASWDVIIPLIDISDSFFRELKVDGTEYSLANLGFKVEDFE